MAISYENANGRPANNHLISWSREESGEGLHFQIQEVFSKAQLVVIS